MKAVIVDKSAATPCLAVVERPVPEPGAGEILIEVAAAGINRADISQKIGKYPLPPGISDVLGLEVSGTVARLGPGASRYRLGDRVCALVKSGGYAEFCAAPEVQCLPVPAGIDLVEAAGLPEAIFTVWPNLFDLGRLAAGEWVLVHGGASGIGTTAIQLARAFGASVLTTAGGPSKCAALTELGAHRAIDYRSERFEDVAMEITEGAGVDVVVDIVGGDYVARNLAILKTGGRLVQIAFQDGSEIRADFMPILRKRLTWVSSALRARSVEEKGVIARDVEEKVWPLLESGAFRPLIDALVPLDQAESAHAIMERGAHVGKVLLTTG